MAANRGFEARFGIPKALITPEKIQTDRGLVLIRLLKLGDIDGVVDLIKRSLTESEIHSHLNQDQMMVQQLRHSEGALKGKIMRTVSPHLVLVAEELDMTIPKPAGVVCLDGLEIKSLFVSKKSRSVGIGSALVRRMEQIAHLKGGKEVYAYAPTDVERAALLFFQKLGYSNRGIQEIVMEYNDLNSDEIRLVSFFFYLVFKKLPKLR